MCDDECKCKLKTRYTALSVDAPDGYETSEVSDAKTEVTDYFYRQSLDDTVDAGAVAEDIVELLIKMGWRPTR